MRLLIFSLAIILSSCQNTTPLPGSLSTVHTGAYRGSGSVWDWSLQDNGTFSATQKTTADASASILEFSGSYTATSTGFLKFTVGEVSACNACEVNPSVGDTTIGVASPNVVMAIAPIGTTLKELTPMLATGSCPSGTLEVSSTQAQIADGVATDLSTSPFWGFLEIPLTGTISGLRFPVGGTATAQQTFGTTSTCENGTYQVNSGFLFANNLGFALYDDGGGNTVFGFPRDVSANGNFLKNRVFAGILYQESTNESTPVKIEFTSETAGTVSSFSDVTGTTTEELGTLTLVQIGTGSLLGFIEFSLDLGTTGTATLWVGVARNLNDSGRAMLHGSGLFSTANKDSATLFGIQF